MKANVTRENSNKVNLFLIGAAKCGTSSLFYYLSSHPNICASEVKEPQFFLGNDQQMEKKMDQYHSLFKGNEKYKIEASVQYSVPENDVGIHQKIHNYNPEAKIIYIIRNPIHRIESNHWHSFNAGISNIRDVNASLFYNNNIEASRYFRNIKPFIDIFGKDQVLILLFEDLKNDMNYIRQQLSAFLGLEHSQFPNEIGKINVSQGGKRRNLDSLRGLNRYLIVRLLKKILPLKFKRWLISLFSDIRSIKSRPHLNEKSITIVRDLLKQDILKMEKLLGRNLSGWYE